MRPAAAKRMPRHFVLLLHVGYWATYTLLVAIMFRIMIGQGTKIPLATIFLSRIGFMFFVPNIAAFYLQYALLVPRYLAKQRFGKLVLASVAGAIVCATATALLIIAYARTAHEPGAFNDSAFGIIAWLSVMALIHMTIAMVIRGFINWYDEIALKEELTAKNAEVEAALVRAKLDPHFLFNTLNNIDVLVTRDAAAASSYLNQLSDILRFVLYEAQSDRVALDSELAYFDKYIALQRIRISNPAFVSYQLTGNTSGLDIAPMLLIPFVENAFKHAAGQRADGAIAIAINVVGDELSFVCSNRYQRGSIDIASSAGGIGRELMERRLALLYPNRHTLNVQDNGAHYAVHLTINLHDGALHNR